MEAELDDFESIQGRIERFWSNLIKNGKEKLTPCFLRARLELLETYWGRFQDKHRSLARLKDAAIRSRVHEEVYTTTEDEYIDAKAKIMASLEDITTTPSNPESSISSTPSRLPKLPSISLPTFSGEQLEWEEFRDLFKSLVGNQPDIAAVQKLHYLKISLKDEAADVVADVPMTDHGYETAWSDLISRYDNKRVLMAAHMRALLKACSVNKESSTEFKRLLSLVLRARRSFESLGRPVEYWDDWFIHVVAEKLDSTTRQRWEDSLPTSTEFPSLEQFRGFLQKRIRALDTVNCQDTPAPARNKPSQSQKDRVNALTTSTGGAAPAESCSLCQGSHSFSYYQRFKGYSVNQHLEHARNQGACFNCLRTKHSVANCPSASRCRQCHEKHHTMLHPSGGASAPAAELVGQAPPSTSVADAGETPPGPEVSSNATALTVSSGCSVLLATAQVTFRNDRGDEVNVRALLDSESEASFISERVARLLKLHRRRVNIPISGLQGTSTGVATQAVSLTMRSPRNADVQLQLVEVFVLPKLTSVLPRVPVARIAWPHLDGLPLADPYYDQPAMVEAVLGADVYGRLLRDGTRTGPSGAPSAQATSLGWVLMGSVKEGEAEGRPGLSVMHTVTISEDLDQTLQRFWEVEEVSRERVLSPEDLHCEELFVSGHSRDSSGRYTVRLPRQEKAEGKLADNRQEALNMLLGLERRLLRKPQLREQYTTFMSDILSLGHMEVVPKAELHGTAAYYLPHHAVFKQSEPQGKIRVVFNASYRTSTGFSLNDTLLSGPKLQPELWLVLTRWRLFRFAFVADIVKMFRQIKVHSEDTALQRILWRPDPTGEIRDYRLLTVVYGTSSAPYLALRTLIQLANDEERRYPLGAEAIRRHSYVDDMLSGGHTLAEAKEVQRQLVATLKAGGFELSKWAASVPELCPDGEKISKLFHDREGVSTLGVLWSPVDDYFALRVAPTANTSEPTKRTVLSDVARFFDPLGWAAPVLVFGKIFIQNLWMAGLDWDQPLPEDLRCQWVRFAEGLPLLNQSGLPRWVNYHDSESSVELHGFSDASSRAYAAVVYLRCTDKTGKTSVNLLVAKTKVAPVKQISVPRLELCGALLVARLLHAVSNGLGFDNVPVVAWTDASVVLA